MSGALRTKLYNYCIAIKMFFSAVPKVIQSEMKKWLSSADLLWLIFISTLQNCRDRLATVGLGWQKETASAPAQIVPNNVPSAQQSMFFWSCERGRHKAVIQLVTVAKRLRDTELYDEWSHYEFQFGACLRRSRVEWSLDLCSVICQMLRKSTTVTKSVVEHNMSQIHFSHYPHIPNAGN